MARIQIPASTPYVGLVCCWFSPLLREVFLRVNSWRVDLVGQLRSDVIGCLETRKRDSRWCDLSHLLLRSLVDNNEAYKWQQVVK